MAVSCLYQNKYCIKCGSSPVFGRLCLLYELMKDCRSGYHVPYSCYELYKMYKTILFFYSFISLYIVATCQILFGKSFIF